MTLLIIPEDVLMLLSGLGLFQAALLAILVYFHPRADRTVNKFLALYILTFSVILSGPFFLKLLSWQNTFFLGTVPLLVGPLMYLYVRSFKETITLRKALPHFSMFFLYVVVLQWWSGIVVARHPDANEIPTELISGFFPLIIFLVRFAHMMLYYFLTRRHLVYYQRSIDQIFSNTSIINLKWGWWLINGYAAIIIVATLIFFLMRVYPEDFFLLYLMMIVLGTPYIYVTSFKGLMQPTIWQMKTEETKQQLEEEMAESEQMQKSKTARQVTNDGKLDGVVRKINVAMDEHKLYQEPELTLQQLSAHLNVPSHVVSQAINDGMNKSFYDLVNGLRVEEAKRLLLHPKSEGFTILSVGFEAGFNSKTTFNTVFKKFTGHTPTNYREQQRSAILH